MKTIGRYEVLDEVARGGMGAVLRGRSPSGQVVAIKLMLEANDPELITRFDRERAFLEDLGEEAGFVPLLEAGVSPRGPYLVMPFIEGGTLSQRLRNGPLSLKETLTLGRTLARALGRAHARGIVHRDLKPANILFGPSGKPLIADLGLAKETAASKESLTVTGINLGTPTYAAPEQMRDGRSAGATADVYALGAILWECLVGRPAFPESGTLALFEAKLRGVESLPSGTPGWVVAVLRRALDPDPARRYADGDAFASALVPQRAASRILLAGLLGLVGLAALVELARYCLSGSRDHPDPSRFSATAHVPSVTSPAETPLARALREAEACYRRQDATGTIAAATSAIDLDPRCAVAWTLKAEGLYMQRGEDGVALETARQAIDLDPTLPRAWFILGSLATRLKDQGTLEEATKHLRQLLPEEAPRWTLEMALAKMTQNSDELIRACEQIISCDPTNESALIELAQALWASGKRERALASVDRLIELNDTPAWRVRRAELRYELGRDDAMEDADRAVALDPKEPNGYYVRGVIRYRRGDNQGARADFKILLQLAPNHAGAGDARRVLASPGH